MRFAVNHITAPNLPLAQFFALTKALGCTEVEIRNDLPNVLAQYSAAEVKAAAEAAGVTILSINALYPFNLWSDDLYARAVELADYAAASGAKALVMCPLNEGVVVDFDDLVAALVALEPILETRGLIGLVEPLGFPSSSLRRKSLAVQAIKEAGAEASYRLVHDTFHHHLAAETEIFPDWTGLVHISGVEDAALQVAQMQDAHRVLVGTADRLGNLAQINALAAAGYRGPFSFEPFAAEVQALGNPQAALQASMDHIRAAL